MEEFESCTKFIEDNCAAKLNNKIKQIVETSKERKRLKPNCKTIVVALDMIVSLQDIVAVMVPNYEESAYQTLV